MHRSGWSIGLSAMLAASAYPASAADMPMPSVTIVSPANGATIRGTSISVAIQATNFKLECADVGKPGTPAMQGHVHAMVDGMDMAHLANMYCSDHFSISTLGLKPGKHMLAVVLADDAHEMDSAPAMVTFTYAGPTRSLPRPEGAKASVAVVSPVDGATVSRQFDLVVRTSDFHLSCDLEGRPDVAGYGHIHVFASQPGVTDRPASAPMAAMMQTEPGKMMAQRLSEQSGMSMKDVQGEMTMAMVGMLGMPCTTTIPVDLSSWPAGPTKLVVMLANDDHMPVAGAPAATLTVNLR